ncbi:MAG: hypothetical protein HOW97_07970 [Catenulispora sp.]|nr:hypothetical protein [Catenulispora sp.]
MDVNEIVAQLIEDSGKPGAFDRMSALMKTLPEDVQREVYGRLTDITPNPTGDR